MKWCIYYDNCSTFSSNDGSPWDAPRVGVVLIVQEDERAGWVMACGDDYYYFEPDVGGWRNTSQFGFYDHLIRAKTPCALFGRMVDDATYAEMRRRVAEEWGPKSGWLPTEGRRGT